MYKTLPYKIIKVYIIAKKIPYIISVEAAKVLLLYYGEHKLEDMIFFFFFFGHIHNFQGYGFGYKQTHPAKSLGDSFWTHSAFSFSATSFVKN